MGENLDKDCLTNEFSKENNWLGEEYQVEIKDYAGNQNNYFYFGREM